MTRLLAVVLMTIGLLMMAFIDDEELLLWVRKFNRISNTFPYFRILYSL